MPTDPVRELRDLADRMDVLAAEGYAVPIAEHLAETWEQAAERRMGKDTRQLLNRTQITYVGGTASRGRAELIADTPYAGHHNYGTRHTPPNRFWHHGRDAALTEAGRLGVRVGADMARVLNSGGHPNPRALL